MIIIKIATVLYSGRTGTTLLLYIRVDDDLLSNMIVSWDTVIMLWPNVTHETIWRVLIAHLW